MTALLQYLGLVRFFILNWALHIVQDIKTYQNVKFLKIFSYCLLRGGLWEVTGTLQLSSGLNLLTVVF